MATWIEVHVDLVANSGFDIVGCVTEAMLAGVDVDYRGLGNRCQSTEGKKGVAAHVG